MIVDGAEHLNRNAANALLKLLEEPPPKALLLLVCASPGRLLATMRSRCRTLRLAPLDDTVMGVVLGRLLPELEASERQSLAALCGGSPGRARALAAEDGIALSALAHEALSQPARLAGLWSYELADTVLKREAGFSTFLDLLSQAISTTIRRCVREGADDALLASPLLASRSAAGWAATCAELARLRDETEGLNLDKRQALLAGLSLLSGS